MPRFLIKGQGVSGTVLCHELLQQGADVYITDALYPDAASRAAAGIVNPITGKLFVKSWRIDDLLPAAKALYRNLEITLGQTIWHDQPVCRLLNTNADRNQWATRAGMPDYAPYICASADHDWGAALFDTDTPAMVCGGGRADLKGLCAAFRQRMQDQGRWIDNYALQHGGAFDAVIHCEGYRAAQNPLFQRVPWQLNKGEALLLRFPDLRAPWPTCMLKKNILLTHLNDGLFWAGAPYIHTFQDALPSAEGRAFVEQGVREMIRLPFVVEDHLAGIRPAVAGRRPFIGRHPEQTDQVLFNGFGAKATSLVPFWAAHLSRHLLEGTPIDPEVALERAFNKPLSTG
jgi:glycine/D-amino acid oxidase-like deaminating enzyme